MRRNLLAILLVGIWTVAPVTSHADASSRIDDVSDQILWTGNPVTGSTTAIAVPEACAAQTCDTYEIDLDLPAGALDGDGLQVMIRWPDENDDLDLFVYGPDGALVGESAGPVSRGEGIIVRDAANGTYRVLIVPVVAEEVVYEGLAEIEFATAVEPLRETLPDLISLPARHLRIATSAYLFDLPVPSMPNGCYPEEMAEQGALRCLRFDQVLANVGDGPFEMRYRIDGMASEETRDLVQRIYSSDGSWRERFADTYVFHPTHAHFHYENFAQSHLYRSNANGDNLGLAKSGRKNGFCMVDVEPAWWGDKGDAARTYIPPGCLLPTEADPETGELSALSGISVGWADVYNWYLPDQFIEISGLEDGFYILENIADQAGTVEEVDDTNNAACVLIRLTGDDAQILPTSVVCP